MRAQERITNNILIEIKNYLDNGITLDRFTLRNLMGEIKNIPNIPEKLMVTALAHGAAGSHKEAVSNFKCATKYKDELVAINYLAYLAIAGDYELYLIESVRLAREIISMELYANARNATYMDGDSEISSFFAQKAILMMSGNDRKEMEDEVRKRMQKLNSFAEVTKFSKKDISKLSNIVFGIAKKYSVNMFSCEFYTDFDGAEAAVIGDVICMDSDILSSMDIDVATEIAIDPLFSDKPITAWFRGADRKKLGDDI
ncbi:hypothetical protein [Pectobacterium carotovorum]|uniref:hypothetical protein n=1 Tax=Pectobacterium carotovorum TaxID=554 RepID=UPI001373FE49|nr:hypothetical protein [Pectobacterium carotovorum]QHP58533.1 hypothetical protein EH204_11405 [Pectobacterium carotovorum subsp. carotovorum]